jgi:hypothetical protein
MDIMAIVAICFPLGMVGMVLAITWIMSDAGHRSKRPRLIERKAA